MNWNNLVLSVLVAALVAACGGGGGNASTPTYDVSSDATFGSGTSGNTGGSGSTSSGSTTTTTNVSSNAAGSVILSLTSNQISASQPTTVTAVVKDAAGLPVAGALIQFSLSGTGATALAGLAPESALTDASGQAATTLTPLSGATTGAAYVNASADTAAGTLTARKAFSVSATNVSLSGVSLSPSSINGYNTASINITVAGASSTTPVTVNVSSTCATTGKAAISPTSLTLTGSSGSVTYQDKGCGSATGSGSATDRVSVQIVGTTQQRYADLTVAAPVTQGIQYVSVDNPTICLVGTGCPSVANVVFKVVDQTGAAQQGVLVDFSLSNSAATLGSTSGVTASDGQVSVAVASKSTPTPIRVAALVHGTSLQTVSNTLTISGGLPVAGVDNSHNGISFAPTKYGLNGNMDGDFAVLSLHLTDRYGAPAVNGTVVNLVSDGGTVVPAYCVTTDGACNVKLVVTNPRPLNGRVHVVAYANGQEYFVDTDGDGIHDNGESYDDVAAAVCLDKNENDSCDATEFIVGDINAPDAGNGAWDSGGSAFARLQRTFFFTRTAYAPRLYAASGGVCTDNLATNTDLTVAMGGAARASIQFCVRDANTNADADYGGNPIAAGSTIVGAPTMANAEVTVGNSPVPSVLSGPTIHTLTVKNTSTTTPQPALASGTADLTFNMDGNSFTLRNVVTITP